MKKDLTYIIVLCACFGLFFIADKMFFSSTYHAIEDTIHAYPVSYFITYLLVGLPVIIFVYFTNGHRFFEPLGLNVTF